MTIFLVLLVTSVAVLTILVAFAFYIFAAFSPFTWMHDMWGSMTGMMGGSVGPVVSTSPSLSHFGLAIAILAIMALVGLAGVLYYLVYPEIKSNSNCSASNGEEVGEANTTYGAVYKTLTESERRVVNVLALHKGQYLQKYIRKETGLSRLQTHRIVARLAERGIVKLERSGNTNIVLLADWLQTTITPKTGSP
jgi:hypothetical protein